MKKFLYIPLILFTALFTVLIASCSMRDDIDELKRGDSLFDPSDIDSIDENGCMVAYGVLQRGKDGDFDKILTDGNIVLVLTNNKVDEKVYSQSGERIFFNCTLTAKANNPNNDLYRWYTATLNELYNLTSKPVVIASSLNESGLAALGNDVVDVSSAWFAGGYLNIDLFADCSEGSEHTFNLLFDDKASTESVMRYMITHNAHGDVDRPTAKTMLINLSFNLSPLLEKGSTSLSTDYVSDNEYVVVLGWVSGYYANGSPIYYYSDGRVFKPFRAVTRVSLPAKPNSVLID